MGVATAFLAFGSNQGNRLDLCDRAVTLLGLLPRSRLTGISSLYETEPVIDERTDPGTTWFLNGVMRLETELPPRQVLDICREVERALGRDEVRRNGPRPIDLDLLFYGSEVLDTPDLVVPHPRLHLRRFVLTPLAELAPDWRHPVLDTTVQDLLDGLQDASIVRRLDPQPMLRSRSRPACTGRGGS